MTLAQFNRFPAEKRRSFLFDCCGSTAWVNSMLAILPAENIEDLLDYAEEEWYDCNAADWLEAFKNHSHSGDKDGFLKTGVLQSDLSEVDKKIIPDILLAHQSYEDAFGYTFISCTTGKTISELFSELRERLNNDPRDEIAIAAAEQNKITKCRLKKLLSGAKARL